jgi:hypothetical protein
MSTGVRRALLAAVVVGIAVLLPAHDTVAVGPADADVVATAHAAEGTAHRFDTRSSVGRLTRNGQARATATASAMCTGCEGDARTVQILYAQAPQVVVDNVAAAWASCVDCSATSVAVQVVVLGKRTADMVFANRALAVNAACTGCTTRALAVQFVISGGNRHELSEQARAIIAQLSTQLALDLESPRPGRRSAQVSSESPGLSSLSRLAMSAPEARSVERAASALRSEFGRDAVSVSLDVRRDGQ